jgi:hypothetical protein
LRHVVKQRQAHALALMTTNQMYIFDLRVRIVALSLIDTKAILFVTTFQSFMLTILSTIKKPFLIDGAGAIAKLL